MKIREAEEQQINIRSEPKAVEVIEAKVGMFESAIN